MSEVHAPALLAIPWYRHLAVRLTVLLLVAHVFFLFLLPWIYDLSMGLFGLPQGGASVFVGRDSEPAVLRPSELSRATARLLARATLEAPGHWRPHPTDVSATTTELARRDRGFVWLGVDREVLAASPGLRWSVGEVMGFPVKNEPAPKAGGELCVHAVLVPVHAPDGKLAAWFVPLCLESGACSAVAGAGGLESSGATPSRRRLLASLVTLGAVVLTGLLVSIAVSRLVTRRLSRLAREVAVPFRGEGDLPGPFDDSGHDEIALLARAMNLTRARAEQLIERLGERETAHRTWVAQVSHDLRTPLTALMACFDRADIEMVESEGEELRARMLDLVGSMRIDAQRVNTLADDLLDVARLDMRDALVLEPVLPAELVRYVVRVLKPAADAQGITLEVRCGPKLPSLKADGRRLMRALENLLRNALQHARSRVRVGAQLVGGNVRFEVRDDGPGLPEDDGRVDFAKLSGRGQRSDSAGLGLLIARKVMQAHRGRIGAYNLPDDGAVVWLELEVPESDSSFDLEP